MSETFMVMLYVWWNIFFKLTIEYLRYGGFYNLWKTLFFRIWCEIGDISDVFENDFIGNSINM